MAWLRVVRSNASCSHGWVGCGGSLDGGVLSPMSWVSKSMYCGEAGEVGVGDPGVEAVGVSSPLVGWFVIPL